MIDDKFNAHHVGYVQSMINQFFPEKLSNYFFFDGERWNDDNNKTEDIKKSINTILGISSILKLKEHLKDGNGVYKTSVLQKLNKKIKPTSSESQTYANKIEQLERSIQNEEKNIDQFAQDIVVAQKDIEEYERSRMRKISHITVPLNMRKLFMKELLRMWKEWKHQR